MANERLKRKILTSYVQPADYNIIKFFANEHKVSISKLIEDALYYMILIDGEFTYPQGGFNYAERE